jgi:signal transduction histidine kinase
VGAMLSVVKMNVSLFERKCGDIKAKELANETKSHLDDLITQVRRISRDLMPLSLEKLGLAIACEELAGWINKSGIIKVDFWCSRGVRRLESKKELAIFRITQELLNNSIKHSGASQISLKIRFSKTGFVLAIRDNGRGFETDKLLKTGLGLKNLESRAKILGAKYKIDSSPGKGTRAFLFLTSKDESDE